MEFNIGNVFIGSNHPPVVVAEIGINHNGSLIEAKKIADLAISSGAKIIKHQTHIVEDEMSSEAKEIVPGNADISIYEIIKNCALSKEEEYSLMKYIQSKGAVFISTPFSRAAANLLEEFDVPAYKIGSGECNNYPLIKHVASFGKPIILSTGMNNIQSVKKAVEIIEKHKVPYALLHCTNIYPTPPEMVRLGAMQELMREFPNAVVGLSDHTCSNYACLGAVALGASLLERHFTDSMNRKGPDIVCSMDPKALQNLIQGSLEIYKASGGSKGSIKAEAPTMAFAFASVVTIDEIKEGEKFSEENIWVKRPGTGDFLAIDYDNILGKTAKSDIPKGCQLKKSDVSF